MNRTTSETPDLTTSDVINSYHQGLKEAVDFVQSHVIGILKGQINLSRQEGAVIGIFYRVHTLAHSLIRLNNRIDFNAVAIIARTMFELLIDLRLLARSDINEQDLDRFFSFPEVDRFRKAGRVVEFQKRHPKLADESLLDSSVRQEFVTSKLEDGAIEAKVCTLWGTTSKGRPLWPDHWSGLSVRDRATMLGPSYEQKYLEVYAILSWYTHSGNTAYFQISEKGLESVYGIFLDYSRKLYIESLLICSKTFNLKEGITGFLQVIAFLEEAPSNLLMEYGLKKVDEAKHSDPT